MSSRVQSLLMFQSCLICTDFQDSLDRFAQFIPDLAQGGLKKIVFLHSIPVWQQQTVARVDQEQITQAREHLAGLMSVVPEGVEVKIEVLTGRPTDTIPRFIATEQIDVIFAGTPVRGNLEAKIFGSTSREIAQSVPNPLMIFRPQLIYTYTQEEFSLRCQHLFRSLLIPYNDSEAANYLITQIKKYASKRSPNSFSECTLLWVIEETTREEVLKKHRLQQAQDKLNIVKAELEKLDLNVSVRVKQGNPLLEIVQTAIALDISAIALATDSHNRVLDWTMGSIVNEMLHRIWFPLLFFVHNKE